MNYFSKYDTGPIHLISQQYDCHVFNKFCDAKLEIRFINVDSKIGESILNLILPDNSCVYHFDLTISGCETTVISQQSRGLPKQKIGFLSKKRVSRQKNRYTDKKDLFQLELTQKIPVNTEVVFVMRFVHEIELHRAHFARKINIAVQLEIPFADSNVSELRSSDAKHKETQSVPAHSLVVNLKFDRKFGQLKSCDDNNLEIKNTEEFSEVRGAFEDMIRNYWKVKFLFEIKQRETGNEETTNFRPSVMEALVDSYETPDFLQTAQSPLAGATLLDVCLKFSRCNQKQYACETPKTEFILIIDTYHKYYNEVILFVKRCPANSRIQIMRFDGDTLWVAFDGLQPCSQEVIDEAMSFTKTTARVEQDTCDCCLPIALEKAYSEENQPGFQRCIILMTANAANYEKHENFELIKHKTESSAFACHLFTIGGCKRRRIPSLLKMARVGRGRWIKSDSRKTFSPALLEAMHCALTPHLQDVRLEIRRDRHDNSDVMVVEQVVYDDVERLGRMFDGEFCSVFIRPHSNATTRFNVDATSKVVLRATLNHCGVKPDEEVEFAIPIAERKTIPGGETDVGAARQTDADEMQGTRDKRLIECLVAHRHIQTLEAMLEQRKARNLSEDQCQRIEQESNQLCQQWNLMSPRNFYHVYVKNKFKGFCTEWQEKSKPLEEVKRYYNDSYNEYEKISEIFQEQCLRSYQKPKRILRILVYMQNLDGSWSATKKCLEVLGHLIKWPRDDSLLLNEMMLHTNNKQLNIPCKVWTSILAMEILRLKCDENEHYWNWFVWKCRVWLEQTLTECNAREQLKSLRNAAASLILKFK